MGDMVGDICAGSLSMGLAAALEGRDTVAIDNDKSQMPLATGRVAHAQRAINKEHSRLTKKKSTRESYDLSLSTHRFLKPLNTHLPYASYKRDQDREQERKDKAQRKLPGMWESQEEDEEDVVASASLDQRKAREGQNRQTFEDAMETERLLFQFALRESKMEEEQQQKVLSLLRIPF